MIVPYWSMAFSQCTLLQQCTTTCINSQLILWGVCLFIVWGLSFLCITLIVIRVFIFILTCHFILHIKGNVCELLKIVWALPSQPLKKKKKKKVTLSLHQHPNITQCYCSSSFTDGWSKWVSYQYIWLGNIYCKSKD